MTESPIRNLSDSFDGLAAEHAENPGRPAMLSHVAYITRDTAATADFYTRILGMELVNAVLDDSIPSTGEPVPYFHSFFRMSDGSTVAFFEAQPPGYRKIMGWYVVSAKREETRLARLKTLVDACEKGKRLR